MRGLAKGWAPTLIGYSMQGLCKFGFYEVFKNLYSNMLGEVSSLFKLWIIKFIDFYFRKKRFFGEHLCILPLVQVLNSLLILLWHQWKLLKFEFKLSLVLPIPYVKLSLKWKLLKEWERKLKISNDASCINTKYFATVFTKVWFHCGWDKFLNIM